MTTEGKGFGFGKYGGGFRGGNSKYGGIFRRPTSFNRGGMYGNTHRQGYGTSIMSKP